MSVNHKAYVKYVAREFLDKLKETDCLRAGDLLKISKIIKREALSLPQSAPVKMGNASEVAEGEACTLPSHQIVTAKISDARWGN